MKPHTILPILLSLALSTISLSAQSWSLNISSNPPAELWRWTSGEAQLRLTVTDVGTAGRAEVQVRIRLDGRIVATTGRMPIDLLPDPAANTFVGFEFISFAGTDFPDPTLRSRVLSTGRLPSGSYSICVVVNGIEQTLDCPDFEILSLTPPHPLVPGPGDTVYGSIATFEWDPLFPLPISTVPHYRVVVTEIYPSQRPRDAFYGNPSIYDETFVALTSIPWPTLLANLRPGVPHAWSVQGLDAEGNPLGEPDGWGEVRTFYFAPADQVPAGLGRAASSDDAERPAPRSDTLLFVPTTKQSGRELSPRPAWVDTVGNILLTRERLDGGDTMAASFYGVIDSIVIAERSDRGRTRYWSGRMLGSPESYVIFAGRDDLAVGNILRNDTLYLVRDFGRGVHKLIRVDPSGFPQDSPPIRPELPTDSVPTFSYTNTDPPDRVDVMVLYTPQTLARGMSEGLLQLEIELALEEANLSFSESGLDLRLVPRHFDRIDIDESQGVAAALGALRRDEEVARLRDRYHADLVLLIIDDDGGIPGQSFILPDLHPWYEGYGFGVIGRQGLAIQTLPHEAGHLFGAGHDCLGTTDPTDEGRSPSSHGYVDTTRGWGTMMARRGEGRGRVLRWSDPTGEYAGDATGSHDARPCGTCNACTLREAGMLVANYRSASAQTGAVWLKDTWHDAGVEPGRQSIDSNRFGWESPYIWLRSDPDSGEIRLPREQSEGIQDDAYLYVMLHNGGEDSTGVLELWRRPVALGAGGPEGWKRVDTVAVTLPPYHTRVLYRREHVGSDTTWSWLVRFIPTGESAESLPSAVARSGPVDYALARRDVALRSVDVIPLYDAFTSAERRIAVDPGPTDNPLTLEVRLEELGLDRRTLLDEGIAVSITFDALDGVPPVALEGSLRDAGSGGFRLTDPIARFRLPSGPEPFRGEMTIRIESTGGERGYWRREHGVRIILSDDDRVIDGTTLKVRTRKVGE